MTLFPRPPFPDNTSENRHSEYEFGNYNIIGPSDVPIRQRKVLSQYLLPEDYRVLQGYYEKYIHYRNCKYFSVITQSDIQIFCGNLGADASNKTNSWRILRFLRKKYYRDRSLKAGQANGSRYNYKSISYK